MIASAGRNNAKSARLAESQKIKIEDGLPEAAALRAGALARRPDFRLDPPMGVEPELLEEGCLTVLPQRTGWDGAFAARLRRVV